MHQRVPEPVAVFFDVDFTLIRPGRRFLGAGYAETCERHGIEVDPLLFDTAVAQALPLLDTTDLRYDDQVFVAYTARIIELMGGRGAGVESAAREIYVDWAEHRHFEMYADVTDTLHTLHKRGIRLGLISNSHRPLGSFGTHFNLDGLFSVTVSSAEFGVMKPDPRIFEEALGQMRVRADEAVMVGDSFSHDVAGARGVGMHGVLLDRARRARDIDPSVPVIRTLRELPDRIVL